MSRSVVVGELRITVSERIAPSSIVAVGRLGSMPFWRKRSITSVAVEPDRVEGGGHRHGRLDRPDVVVVEDLHDLGLLDARHALRLLGVVHEQHAARGGADQIGARRPARSGGAAVDRHGGAVVDALDLVGDVRQQVVRSRRSAGR